MTQFTEELDSLTRTTLSGEVGRRDFIKVALGTGFAAAVLPVQAQNVITTDTVGLTAGEVTLTIGGQSVPMYRAQPAQGKDFPVILVVSEIFGVHQYVADVARRFAKQGYMALAPELFVRQGDAHHAPSIPELMKNIIAKVPDAQVMGDLDACVAWAKANGGNTDKLGITGFCWGGRITWLYSAHNPKVKAGVAWYGRLVGDKTALAPQHPLDIVPSLENPGARTVRRQGQRHSARYRRKNEGGAGPGRQRFGVRGLSGCRPCLPCRLPAELCRGRCQGRLAPGAGMVQGARRGLSVNAPCRRCVALRGAVQAVASFLPARQSVRCMDGWQDRQAYCSRLTLIVNTKEGGAGFIC